MSAKPTNLHKPQLNKRKTNKVKIIRADESIQTYIRFGTQQAALLKIQQIKLELVVAIVLQEGEAVWIRVAVPVLQRDRVHLRVPEEELNPPAQVASVRGR